MRLNRTSQFVIFGGLALLFCLSVFASDEGLKPGAEYPALSPEGTKLVFVTNISGDRDLWIADSNGANSVPLLLWPGSDEKQPTWSPDGKHIVFSSNRNSAKHNIWVIDADGSNPSQLTSDNAEHEQPRYSPDGSAILFLSNAKGKRDLWTMKSDGTAAHAIALINARISDPAWSPSGKQIVYVGCTRGAACNLFQIGADGSGGAQITNGSFQDWTPDWGTPGIIFASNRGGAQGLWFVQSDGSQLQQVTAPDGSGDLDPRFQPGTSTFVFSRAGVSPADAAADIWRVQSIDTPPQRLTRIPIDTTPPVTTATVTPSPNANGWNNTDVKIILHSTDNEPNGTGVKQIQFSTAGAQAETGIVDGDTSVLTISVEGTTVVTYFATDRADNQEAPHTLTIMLDKTPPIISGLPGGSCILWPPNHKLVSVGTVSADDTLSGLASLVVTGASSEPPDSDVDIVITGSGLEPRRLQLRAERLGNGLGRTYTLQATAIDLADNVTNVTSTCTVPHDRGN